jgi:2-methylisocitrate lyase-like PEP mutase family enzyme
MILTLEVEGRIVTHRVVRVHDDGTFVTKGDANQVADDFSGLDVKIVARGTGARRTSVRTTTREHASASSRRSSSSSSSVAPSSGDRRARFRELHAGARLFVMPNPWDAGSARLLAARGFEALATTSAGFAWSLGRLDQRVSRGELVAHVAALSGATDLPLNVDSERCYPDDAGGVAETVALLADAGAAGCSIEDYDPAAGGMDDVETAAGRVAEAAAACRALPEPMVLTARAENHIRGVDDLDDTIARLLAYREAGADVVYAPGLVDLGRIAAVVEAVGIPVNVLALPTGPSIGELEEVGVRRVSTGSLLASAAYGALLAGAQELQERGTSLYAEDGVSGATLRAALGD